MAQSGVVKTKRDGLITVADNAGFGGANVLDVTKEIGNFTVTTANPQRNNFLDRGRLDGSVRYGDDVPAAGSFSHYFRDAFDGAVATLFDVWNWDGAGSSYVDANWVSTGGANAEVPTADLRYTIEGSDHGDGADHTLTWLDVSFDYVLTEGDPTLAAVNWQSHTDTRPARA